MLRSGDHQRVARWRRARALERTLAARPDLIEQAGVDCSDADRAPAGRVPADLIGALRPRGPGDPFSRTGW
ncbi:MAG: hypothetical protein V9E94_06810 [Microthrixaceae bacterium]